MTQEKLLDKLSKIKNHMESAKEIGNEAEAQAFATMLQNLLIKHKLEMTDVEYANHTKEEPIEEVSFGGFVTRVDGKRVYEKYPDLEVKRRRVEWMERLAGVLARAHSCEILISPGSSRIWFVGQKSNVQVVDYLYATMLRTAEKLADKEYVRYFYQCRDEGDVTRARGFRPSFLEGFVSRLFQRFEEEKRKMYGDSTGVALVRVNKEALAVRNYLDQKKGGKKAAGLNGSNNFNREGWKRGQATADGLNLRANAVREGQPNRQIGGGARG
jgi:hypothetical protein